MATGDNACTPRFEDSERLPCVAGSSGNVMGGRFVSIAADAQPGWAGLTTSVAGGHPVVARTGAGGAAYGVAAWDASDGDEVTVYRGQTVPMDAGAAVAAGAFIMSDSTGRAITWVTAASEANQKIGICVGAASAAGLKNCLVTLFD